MFLTNIPVSTRISLKCDHVGKHENPINGGGKARKANPYPALLVERMTSLMGMAWKRNKSFIKEVPFRITDKCSQTFVLDDIVNAPPDGEVESLTGLSTVGFEKRLVRQLQVEDEDFKFLLKAISARDEGTKGSPEDRIARAVPDKRIRAQVVKDIDLHEIHERTTLSTSAR